ncbi:MAG: M14 family zinc carboxypeptidase [Phycisphaerae bacterium]
MIITQHACILRAVFVVCCVAACQAQSRTADRGAGGTAATPSVFDIAGEADVELDGSIPTPERILGFELGSRPIRHLELGQYLRALADASDRVELREYGATHEGRTLYYLVVSDPANMARLDALRGDLARLADPRITSDAEAQPIIDTSPAVAWMLYTVHGDELSGTDAAVAAAYRLAAGRDARTALLLKSVVVCIDPLQNPDGRERFLSMLQQYAGRVPTGDTQSVEHFTPWPWGRTNHYLFDLNRDWNVTVHPESRGRVETIAGWYPQLMVDGHEMEPSETYLFSPPTKPLNLHIPPSVLKWFGRYTSDQADAFDRHGWSYYRGEWNEAWAIGFSDIWAMHHGAAGVLYEQARSHGSWVRLPTGRDRHYREDVAHQLVSTLANLRTLAAHRREFLADYYADKKNAVADVRGKGGRNLFLFAPGRDRTRAADFLGLLQRQRIEAYLIDENDTSLKDVVDRWGHVEAKRRFAAGTVVISMRQPLSPLVRAMLEFDPQMTEAFLKVERRELELKNRTRLYDVTGWCIAMGYNLEAYWASGDLDAVAPNRRPATPAAVFAAGPAASPPSDVDVYGYLLDGDDDASIALVGRLLQDGWQVRAANKPFTASGRAYPAGTFLIRRHENLERFATLPRHTGDLPPGVGGVATTARSEDGPDLGGGEFPLLAEPRIALIGNAPFAANSYGALWHLFDARIGLRISRLQGYALGGYDLRKYNMIVLPDAGGGVGLARLLNEDNRKTLDAWMRDGGTLIAIGGTAAALSVADKGLGSARLRRDVLKDLDLYAEAVWRERRAAAPAVDAEQVWQFRREGGFTTTRPADERIEIDDVEALERRDTWARRFMPHGVVVRGDRYPEHWLGHGVRGRVPIMYGARHVLMARPPVETAVRLADAESLRLSGLLWPEARERLAGAAWLTREAIGRGQLILFATDPTFRGYFRGTERVLLNAAILGPGLGTSVPSPW